VPSVELTVIPLDGGQLCNVERSTQQYLTGFGEKICVHLTMWLILGLDSPVLVDVAVGTPENVSLHQQRDLQQTEHPHELLAQHGVEPGDIKTIILSHLHWDHCLGLEMRDFSHATAFVQRKELQYAAAPFAPHKGLYNKTVLRGLGESGYPELRVLDGDYQVAPGIKVIHTPGHTPGTSAVIVDTSEGRYAIASDNVPLKDSWRGATADCWTPNGIHVDLADCYASLRRLSTEADFILPSHCGSVHNGSRGLPTKGY
jgi:N-acyl homoserine lactone hydrolase